MGTPVIIAGMHRSGTSLLANLLQRAGIAIGDRLEKATEYNPKGHFEDLDFMELHRSVLDDVQQSSIYRVGAHEKMPIDEQFRERAQRLVELRVDQSVWGWKDPRTTLFLDFYRELLPEARFVFIYRSAQLVMQSLRRRRDPDIMLVFPKILGWRLGFFRWFRALRMWRAYNLRVLRFVEAHPERCVVVSAVDLEQDLPRLVHKLRDEWGLPVADVSLDDAFDPQSWHTEIPTRVQRFCSFFPSVRRIEAGLASLRQSTLHQS